MPPVTRDNKGEHVRSDLWNIAVAEAKARSDEDVQILTPGAVISGHFQCAGVKTRSDDAPLRITHAIPEKNNPFGVIGVVTEDIVLKFDKAGNIKNADALQQLADGENVKLLVAPIHEGKAHACLMHFDGKNFAMPAAGNEDMQKKFQENNEKMQAFLEANPTFVPKAKLSTGAKIANGVFKATVGGMTENMIDKDHGVLGIVDDKGALTSIISYTQSGEEITLSSRADIGSDGTLKISAPELRNQKNKSISFKTISGAIGEDGIKELNNLPIVPATEYKAELDPDARMAMAIQQAMNKNHTPSSPAPDPTGFVSPTLVAAAVSEPSTGLKA